MEIHDGDVERSSDFGIEKEVIVLKGSDLLLRGRLPARFLLIYAHMKLYRRIFHFPSHHPIPGALRTSIKRRSYASTCQFQSRLLIFLYFMPFDYHICRAKLDRRFFYIYFTKFGDVIFHSFFRRLPLLKFMLFLLQSPGFIITQIWVIEIINFWQLRICVFFIKNFEFTLGVLFYFFYFAHLNFLFGEWLLRNVFLFSMLRPFIFYG